MGGVAHKVPPEAPTVSGTETHLRQMLQGEYLNFVEGTIEDYYRLEEQKAEFLEEGIVVMHSPASITHEEIFMELATKMNVLAQSHNFGRVLGSRATVVLGEHRLEPDIVFIGKENPGKFTEMEFSGVPDAVIEIVSKTTREYDLKTKREIYRRHGVKEIYFVDYLNNTLIVDVLEGNSYRTHTLKKGAFDSRILPGFSIPVFTAPR